MDNEEKIKVLEKLRDDIEMACKCEFLSFPEKEEWGEQVKALNWALSKIKYYERKNK